MRRREFIFLVGGAAAAWSSEGHPQQPGKKIYRVGLLTNGLVIGATDERRKNLVSALAAQGFVEGQRGARTRAKKSLGREQCQAIVESL